MNLNSDKQKEQEKLFFKNNSLHCLNNWIIYAAYGNDVLIYIHHEKQN